MLGLGAALALGDVCIMGGVAGGLRLRHGAVLQTVVDAVLRILGQVAHWQMSAPSATDFFSKTTTGLGELAFSMVLHGIMLMR
jgi:hypothetical protein